MNRSDLERIRQLNDSIIFSLERISALKSRATSLAIKYDDTGASHPAPENKLELIWCMIDQEERKVNRLIDKRYALKMRAVKAIQSSGLPIEARHVLYLRYLATEPTDHSNLDWRKVIYFVNKYHNIRKTKIYNIHHEAINLLKHHNI